MTILSALGFLNLSLVDIVDILVVAAIIFAIYRWIKGSSAMNIFVAIILLLIVQVVAVALGMKMMSSLLGTIIDVGAIALIVIFQPEIRQFLNRLGRSTGFSNERKSAIAKLLGREETGMSPEVINEVTEACREMAEQKTGALIVIPHNDHLQSIIDTGDTLDSLINRRIIENIFFKNSPLHDGAMILGKDRIIAARCTLPITERTDIPARFGMRHKSAMGISERSDADVIVVSEQTGKISFFRDGKFTHIDNINTLKLLLEGNNGQQAGS